MLNAVLLQSSWYIVHIYTKNRSKCVYANKVYGFLLELMSPIAPGAALFGLSLNTTLRNQLKWKAHYRTKF